MKPSEYVEVAPLWIIFFIPSKMLNDIKSDPDMIENLLASGATMISMKNLLEPLGKNLVFFTDINNKL